MGKTKSGKHRHRSRSRSRDRERSQQKDRRRRRSRSEFSLEDDPRHGNRRRSLSPSPRRGQRSRERSSGDRKSRRSEERSRRKGRSRSESADSSEGHRSRSSKKKKKKKMKSESGSPSRILTASDIERLKEAKQKEKDLMKALETPEEKRARRLAKKEAKERKRKTNMGWDEEYMGYTNADNPFGDEHLLDTFVWSKKLQKEGMTDIENDKIEKLQKMKMMENKIELEKVKKRRLEREKEREAREEEREMMQRDKEAEYYKTWENQEDSFHLQQAQLRSNIRIQDGRAKPIDLLAKYINAEDEDFDVEMHEPYAYLNGLTARDLEDLLEDIKVYLELEQAENTDYWRDITTITEDELNLLRKMDPSSRGERPYRLKNSLKKNRSALSIIVNLVLNRLGVIMSLCHDYVISLLQQLKAHMAKTRLRERHEELLRKKLFRLKREQGISASEPLFPITTTEDEPEPSTSNPEPPPKEETIKEEVNDDKASDEEREEEDDEEPLITEDDVSDQCVQDYQAAGYSPKLIPANHLEPGYIIHTPDEDRLRLQFARKSVQQTGIVQNDTDAELVKAARDGMTNDEASFSVQVPLEKQTMLWSDKYRPRKPRFFNRVHTGFEWNKYNQTHYDVDNPPPKIVQGYKFNIFYPDLIDKTKTPQYHLTPIKGNTDFAILRFSAGPPYEDIAFKIVSREWEHSYKRGFRCQFHNNIFQLWFHFKRYRYRR
ncbi:hypothetical protein CAPTEDRAFT_161063 [Capitella teleta]|uniref:Splicing factor Cactin n=1 Tax=Capitella teleta TaxID=283909 RepID=R7VMD7_CAPTE|nr:hypothetical protein CAPTEDRAFT_161063 [Capitella teleta]|eukprot:ELU18660.1 hypothetical protein CAPTEDRAFT_161063 [Capitella teleta]